MTNRRDKLSDAKARLDRLIAKSRAHLYKPIAIAEVLYRNRLGMGIDLSQPDHYRRRSYDWCRDVCHRLYNRRPDLNSRYWDQLFDPAVLPPESLESLGHENRRLNGIVEIYIYAGILDKVSAILEIVDNIRNCPTQDFRLEAFLALFEQDARFKRSADKAYEIVVYALFSAITKHLEATVSLSVKPKGDILRDFEEFAKLVLGVDQQSPEVTQPAKLYRVGTANAADAGLDMWANFGPAVQVKHFCLNPSHMDKICEGVQADQIVIVCKSVEASSIESILVQVGYRDRIRGVITELDLIRWYDLACSKKYHSTLGKDLLAGILRELGLEFPLTQARQVQEFFYERSYDIGLLGGDWQLRDSDSNST
jgi:hypothetical protein